MKRIILLLTSAFILASCAVTRGRFVSTYFLDFRPYSEAGFFISPNPYPGDFVSIGELSITVEPAILPSSKVPASDKKFEDGIYGAPPSSGAYTETIPASELLDMAVAQALKVGANGLANFKCQAIYSTEVSRYGSSKTLSHYEISGLCISIEK